MEIKIIGYYVDKGIEKGKATMGDAFVVIENEGSRGKYLEGYCPQGQHFELKDPKYLDVSTKITKDEYKEITKGWYTPPEYVK